MDLTISLEDIKKYTSLSGYKLITHQKRKKHMLQLIRKMLPIGSNILDIGCANGDMSNELSIMKYKVDAIEPLKKSYENAKNLTKEYGQNIKIVQTRIEDSNVEDKYDLVIMGEVLEHFYKPHKILKKVRNILKPNGIILITVPNMPSLRNRLKFGLTGIFPDNNPEHKYYFDRNRFKETALKSGYQILYFSTKFTNLSLSSTIITHIENFLLFWFSKLFKNSGDSMFVVLALNGRNNEQN